MIIEPTLQHFEELFQNPAYQKIQRDLEEQLQLIHLAGEDQTAPAAKLRILQGAAEVVRRYKDLPQEWLDELIGNKKEEEERTDVSRPE
jgi:hypothetical protein